MTERITNDSIEKSIADAVHDTAPDLLDQLMTELGREGLSDPSPAVSIEVPARRKKRRLKTSAFTACAAAILVFAGIFGFLGQQSEAAMVIGLDVNPSIELAINNDEKVLSAYSLNDEGIAILKDMDLEGTDVNTACNAVAGAMLLQGYLSDTSNSILVSVRAEDEAMGQRVQEKLTGNLNTYLENTRIAAAIFGQYVQSSDELKAFASEHGISEGKAFLIKNLLASGNQRMTEDSLLSLSTQELLLLSEERKIEGGPSYGHADTSSYITREEAVSAALASAGIDREQVPSIDAEFDCDDGKIIYEVEFTFDGREYDYEIDAATGSVIHAESEIDDGDDDQDADDDSDDNRDADDDSDDGHDDHDDHDDDDHDDDDHDDDDHDDDNGDGDD